MGMTTVSDMTDMLQIVDGTVVGPDWSDDRCRELLRVLRKISPAAPDLPDASEQPGDVEVAARIFHEVLSLDPVALRWPVFSGGSQRPSLMKSSVMHALEDPGLVSLLRLSDASALVAANVARWMLRFKQQNSSTMVFTTSPPPIRHMPRPRTRSVVPESTLAAC